VSLERIIAATEQPATVDSLVGDLRAVGVTAGSVLMVHSSLSSLGYVNGGAPAVIEALTRALGPTGTLVMPTHSSDLSDPVAWREPPVPPAWHLGLRESMPAFDPATTPTWRMGAIPEAFRTHPGVLRSAHPRQSCAARGRRAETITNAHALDCAMGDRSPMGRLYALDAWILLLGVGHDRNTSLHLAEYRATFPAKRETDFGSPVNVYGKRRWHVARDLDFDDSDFARIGDDYEHDTQQVIVGRVAQATARLMRMRPLVDYAVTWMGRNRL
jgi:aminoglycoside 3-N-acetyltransferase